MPVEAVTAAESAGWGLLGGFIVEALEYAGAIKRMGGFPFTCSGEPGLLASLVAIVLRLAASAGLAAAAGASGQIAGPFGAMALGITAPLVVEKILRHAGTEHATTYAKPAIATSLAHTSQRQVSQTEPSDAG